MFRSATSVSRDSTAVELWWLVAMVTLITKNQYKILLSRSTVSVGKYQST